MKVPFYTVKNLKVSYTPLIITRYSRSNTCCMHLALPVTGRVLFSFRQHWGWDIMRMLPADAGRRKATSGRSLGLGGKRYILNNITDDKKCDNQQRSQSE
ncbi:hypothetical protein PRIO_2818 [Paenibacillus riograndensis SBR5]|uniref:Uncharacterized protein n=1 Tax=Paenibacillus riograndensis SBR5 TaxID=1073571 RepID=A0A0E4HAT7_9BACL|nr:hypothetical protein PRIO_2818 [Paenibacillus riograndensis SBR5]